MFKGICHSETDTTGNGARSFSRVKTVPTGRPQAPQGDQGERGAEPERRGARALAAAGRGRGTRGRERRHARRGAGAKQATQEQKDVASKALYKKMLDLIGLKLTDLEATDRQGAEQLRAQGPAAPGKGRGAGGDGVPEEQRNYKAALQILIKVKDTVLARTRKTPSANVGNPDKVFANLFKDVEGDWSRTRGPGHQCPRRGEGRAAT